MGWNFRNALALLAFPLASCSEPATFDEASPAIVDVSPNGEFLNLRVEMPYTGIPGETVVKLGEVVSDVADGLKAGFPGPTAATRWVKIDARFGEGDLKDRFGNYIFPVEALKKHEEGPIKTSVLNLVDRVTSGSGRTVEETIEWCREGSALQQSVDHFCDVLTEAENGQ